LWYLIPIPVFYKIFTIFFNGRVQNVMVRYLPVIRKQIYHEITIVCHRRYPCYRLGLRSIRVERERPDLYPPSFSDHFFLTGCYQERGRIINTQPLIQSILKSQNNNMKKISLIAIVVLLVSLSGCQLVGDIFKAGVGAGIFLVVVVVGLIIFLIAKMSRGK